MASKTEKTTKAHETHMGNLLTQYTYASIKDHNSASDRLDKYKPIVYQSYDNLMKKKDDPTKSDGVESRFSFQTEVRQHCAYILRSCGTEIARVEVPKDSKIAAVISALTDEFQDDSVAAPYLQLGVTYSKYFGATLRGTVDETNWIHAQVIGMLPGLKTNLHLVAEIATAIDNSLRAIAWFLGRGVWFGAEKSISSEVFMNVLAMPTEFTYSLNTLDALSKEIRAKPVRTTKSKKSADAPATVDASTVTDAVTASADAVTTAVATAVSTPVANGLAPPPDGILAADIAKVLEGI